MHDTTHDTAALAAELAAFKAGLRLNKRGTAYRRQAWMVATGELPFEDFNREVIPPGTSRRYPKGAVGIRMDWDFWTAAVLPYRFVGLDCLAIVRTLWPEIAEPTTFPDSGDPWWAAVGDEAREVPGEPWELWSRVTDPDGDVERRRVGTYPDREAALAAERGHRWSMHPGFRVDAEVHAWRDGARGMMEEFPATNLEFVDPPRHTLRGGA